MNAHSYLRPHNLLQAGALHEHCVSGAATVQVLDGRVRARIGDETLDAQRGQVVAFDTGIDHAVEAVVQDDEATHSARVSALTLLAKRHPEFSDTRKPQDPKQHLHLHAGLEETRRLLARIERTHVEDTSTGKLPTPIIIDGD